MPATKKGEGKCQQWLVDHVRYDGDGCLKWPFATNREKGYGMLGYLGQQYYAHRFMCELIHGPAPVDRPQALHLCGNGHLGCVHPKHLKWGTNSENQMDRKRHGRPMGSPHGNRTKLTPEQISEIRALKGVVTQRRVAAKFGIKVGSVEYWQRHDRPPLQPGQSYCSKRRRELGITRPNRNAR